MEAEAGSCGDERDVEDFGGEAWIVSIELRLELTSTYPYPTTPTLKVLSAMMMMMMRGVARGRWVKRD